MQRREIIEEPAWNTFLGLVKHSRGLFLAYEKKRNSTQDRVAL